MKVSTHTRSYASRVGRPGCWLLALSMLLPYACKPRQFVCETEAVFQPVDPERIDGALLNPVRDGQVVDRNVLKKEPVSLRYLDDGHILVQWVSFGHVHGETSLRYSPAEARARRIEEPSKSYPMKRLSDGVSERVRFGFESAICSDPRDLMLAGSCGRERFLIADMRCRR